MPIDRRTFLLSSAAAAGVLALGGCRSSSPATMSSPGEAAEARRLYERIFEETLRASPEMATGLGLDEGERAALKWKLGDASPAGRLGAYQPIVDAIPELEAIDPRNLTAEERARLDTVIWIGERIRAVDAFPFGGIGGYAYPIPYLLTQLTGAYQDVPDFLDSKHTIESRDDAEAYLARLEDFVRNVGHEIDRTQRDAESGVVPPPVNLDKAIAQTKVLREQQGESSPLVSSLVRRAREQGIEGDWQKRATAIVDGPLAAALDRQLALLTRLRKSPGAVGASSLPNGQEYYRLCLRFHTSTNLSPEEAHAIGLEQIAELTAEAEPLLRAEGLTEGSVGARMTALGNLERFLYPNTDAGREELMADLVEQMDRIRARMPEYFATIPRSPMEVKRVPPAIELGAPRGYAQGPSLDGTRPGAYYINLVDTRTWPKWSLPTLTYHESIPGHLWQGSIVLENEAIPLLHRNLGIPAYGEGWALYAEQLADEIGMYADFPQGRIGRIQSFLYRAARIVVDTGLHAMGWSRARAMDYFTENVGLDPISVQNEIDRYIVWPGQACSYKLGHTEFVRLREHARKKLGSRFDIRAFHDVVLLGGDMPLEVLGGLVSHWIETVERGQA